MDKKSRVSDALLLAIAQFEDADREWSDAMAHDARVDPDHEGGVRARHRLDTLWQDRENAHARVLSLGNESRAVPVRKMIAGLRALLPRRSGR